MSDVHVPEKLHLPKDKMTLIIGGGVALVGVYWWWNRAPAVPEPDPAVPASSDATRVPPDGAGASGDGTTGATPGSDAPTDDAAWAQRVLTTMTALNWEPSRVSAVTSKWLDGTVIDSIAEASLVSLILLRVGYPPSGLHPQLGVLTPTPPTGPPPAPGPAVWRGPLMRIAGGGAVLPVKVQQNSVWIYWIRHSYRNAPPQGSGAEQRAADWLRRFNVTTHGKNWNRDTLNPKDTPVINIPASIPVFTL